MLPSVHIVSANRAAFFTAVLGLALCLGTSDAQAQSGNSVVIGPTISDATRARLKAKKGRAAPVARTSAQKAFTASPAKAAKPQTGSGKFAPVLPPKDYAPPVIFVDEKQHDWGSVYQGETVIHKFSVANRGGSDLEIKRIKPSCGCTYVDHDRLIKPGTVGFVTLKIDTKKLRAGKQKKSATIFSNDPKVPQEKVFIEGKVDTIFAIDPKYPIIEVIRGTENPSTVVTLTRTVEEPYKITNITSNTPQPKGATTPREARVETDLEETSDGVYKLTLTALTDKVKTNFYERLDLEIKDGDKTWEQRVSVSVRFKNRISRRPRTVWFKRKEVQEFQAALDGGQPASADATVKSVIFKSEVEGFKFNITKVVSESEFFGVTVEPVTEGSEYKVNVKILKLPDEGEGEGEKKEKQRSLKGSIIVNTDDPAHPEIKFSVIAYL